MAKKTKATNRFPLILKGPRGVGFYVRGVSVHPGMSRIESNNEPDILAVEQTVPP